MNLPHGILRFDALAAADGSGVIAAPASVLLSTRPVAGCRRRVEATLLACGTPLEVDQHPDAVRAHRVSRPAAVLIPGLVNAHTHLDLTHIGPRPFDAAGGFAGWADTVRRERLTDPERIAASVQKGVELSLAAGVVAVGDIAGAVGGKASLFAAQALTTSELNGIAYIEFFAIGPAADANVDRALAAARAADGARPSHSAVRIGLSPHAPYSVSPRSYLRVARERHRPDLSLMTHLAESPAERELIQHGRGPLRDLLQAVGAWDDSAAAAFGHGKSPVGHILDLGLSATPATTAFVHLNDIGADEVRPLLNSPGARVAYCPDASRYFGAEQAFGPHRFSEMLAAAPGAVALGTDSIINLPPGTEAAAAGQFGPLAAARRLLECGAAVDPAALLAMCTENGADLLGLNRAGFRLRSPPGTNLAGVVAVPVRGVRTNLLEGVLRSDLPPELLVLGTA